MVRGLGGREHAVEGEVSGRGWGAWRVRLLEKVRARMGRARRCKNGLRFGKWEGEGQICGNENDQSRLIIERGRSSYSPSPCAMHSSSFIAPNAAATLRSSSWAAEMNRSTFSITTSSPLDIPRVSCTFLLLFFMGRGIACDLESRFKAETKPLSATSAFPTTPRSSQPCPRSSQSSGQLAIPPSASRPTGPGSSARPFPFPLAPVLSSASSGGYNCTASLSLTLRSAEVASTYLTRSVAASAVWERVRRRGEGRVEGGMKGEGEEAATLEEVDEGGEGCDEVEGGLAGRFASAGECRAGARSGR